MCWFLGIYALARQWNAVIIGSKRTETMFKPERRKHVVGRGVLTRKDMAILMRDQNPTNEQLAREQNRVHADCETENGTNTKSKGPLISMEPIESTSGFVCCFVNYILINFLINFFLIK